ncbi:MAG TPA: lipocalin-like domain-containing protein [Magnetospirillaceae bacterium]|jgi:hypothetical protein
MAEISDVIGVWRLRAFYLEDPQTGKRFDPYGADPSGTLILHPGGRMAAVATPSNQVRPKSDAELADAFRRMIAYSGRYRLEPPDRFVTTVDTAWFQPWVGTEQARTFRLDGDNLHITAAPAKTPHTGDALVVGVLSWVREGASTS